MQKFTFAVVLAVLLSFNLSAQNPDFCGTDDQYHNLVEQYPELLQIQKDYEKTIQQRILDAHSKGVDDTIFVVPVVFHVLHDYGAEDIPDSQIYHAINTMNRNNNKLNPDTINIIPEFQDIASKTGIQYRLANIAPDGTCTNGITRIPTVLTNDGSNPVIKFVQWPPQSYLNIWVVKNMNSGTAAFSMYPSAVNSPNTRFLDGIVSRFNYVGTGSTLTHEAGHYLNLQHTWGNTNDPGQSCGDDGVSDTPITKGYTYCPAPENAAICNTGIIENYQNYMDYSGCNFMFTEGQVDRMRAALRSEMAHRDYLVSAQNNDYTGISAEEPSLCAPQVRFFTDKNSRYACTNQPVNFHSQITNGEAETYSWDFPGASPSTSNEANPTVTYATRGWKTVTLTAGNASGSDTYTNEYTIYVFDDTSISGGQITENFETEGHIYGNWIKGYANTNAISYGVNWAWSPIGCLDQGSMKLNVYDNPTREHYEFISPKFNLEGKEGQFFSFKYAFATQSTPENIEASLQVKFTTNCGVAEPTYLTIDDPSQIATAGNYSGINFEPDNPGLWKTGVIQIDNSMTQDGVQFIFEVNTGFGQNNFYIDNVNIGNWLVSNDDVEVVNSLKLYPNPAEDVAQLDFTLNRPSAMDISIFDVAGKKVKAVNTSNYSAGPNTVSVNTSDLPAGAYIVQLRGDEINKSLKLLISK